MKKILLLVKHYVNDQAESYFAQYDTVLATIGKKVGKKGRKYKVTYKGKVYRVIVKRYFLLIKEEIQ